MTNFEQKTTLDFEVSADDDGGRDFVSADATLYEHEIWFLVKDLAPLTGMTERALQRKLQSGFIKGEKRKDDAGVVRWYVPRHEVEKVINAKSEAEAAAEIYAASNDSSTCDRERRDTLSDARSSTEQLAEEVASSLRLFVAQKFGEHEALCEKLFCIMENQDAEITALKSSLDRQSKRVSSLESTTKNLSEKVVLLESLCDMILEELSEIRTPKFPELKPWWKQLFS